MMTCRYDLWLLGDYLGFIVENYYCSSDSITQSIITQGAMLASKLIEGAKFIIRLLEFIMETFR